MSSWEPNGKKLATAELNTRLKEAVARCHASDLIRFSALELQRLFDTGVVGSPLTSPYKQIFHVLGLMVCTPADNPEQLTKERWKEILDSLNDITHSYMSAYFPKTNEVLTENRRKATDVAMPMFLNYFNTLPLLYRKQLIERITSWFTPFSDVFKSVSGLSIDRTLAMVYWVEDAIQKSLDAAWDAREVADKERFRFLDEAAAKHLSPEQMREAAKTDAVGPAHGLYFNATDQMFGIDFAALEQQFGENDAEFFLQLLSAKRGQFKDYFYPTDENPAELHPLFFAETGELFCPAPRVLLLAVLRRSEETLKQSPKSASYLKHRDRMLEAKVVSVLKAFLPLSATILEHACETVNGQFEHDLVILLGNAALVVESKATRQREPLRDPEKAFTRISDDFKSNSGLQKAYEQAERLRRRLVSESQVTLYDKRGGTLAHIKSPLKEAFAICVTLDNFGIVASNLSLLLEKETDAPYPWAVNVFDIETILRAFTHKKRGREGFLLFLRQRAQLQERMFASDELEIVGGFLRAGMFDRYLKETADIIVTTPDMSDIFDEIYYEQNGIPVPERPTDEEGPVLLDVMAELMKRFQENQRQEVESLRRSRAATPKVGRNDLCTCGSGKKYKKCHGR